MAQVCGTGLGNFPKPGDPNLNDGAITARSGLGGIAVSWTFPTVNAHAVAHSLLYRSKSSSFSSAVLIRTVSGDYHFDKQDVGIGTTFYYWVKIVSVNGTVGSEIGPASATLQPTVAELIDIMEGSLNDSTLSQDLRTRIDRITDISSALDTETQERLLGAAYFDQLMAEIKTASEFQDTLILNETNERLTADSAQVTSLNVIGAEFNDNKALIAQNLIVLAEADNAVAARVDFMYARVDENAAAILTEEAVRASDVGAVALSIQTIQASVDEHDVSIQTFQSVQNTVEGMEAQYMVKTDVNGFVSGFGLWSDGNTSDFIVHASRFAIGKPKAAGTPLDEPIVYPFIIADVNGETQIALNARTLIPDAHITNAMIENGIQSDDFDIWTKGWGIFKHNPYDANDPDPIAIFHNIFARGDIEASTIKTGILEAKHIKGGAVSKVLSQTASSKSVSAGGQTYCFTMTPSIPVGMVGNILCMINFKGSAAAADNTNLGVKVVRGSGQIMAESISVVKGFTGSSATSFVASNVSPGTQFHFYITDTWNVGSISAGKVTGNMMLTLM